MSAPLAETAKTIIQDYVGGAQKIPPIPTLPFSVTPDFAAADRIVDVAILLGLIGALLGLGYLIRSALPQTRPHVVAACVLAVLMFTAVNPLFWRLAAVGVDNQGITVERHSAEDLHMKWVDVREVRIQDGNIFPCVQDDTALRLIDAQGQHIDIPRYLRRSPEVAAAVLAALSKQASP